MIGPTVLRAAYACEIEEASASAARERSTRARSYAGSYARSCARRSLDARGAPGGRAEPAPLSPGYFIEGTRFMVVRMLGQGGMGEVYEVEHGALGRCFAMKVLHRVHFRRGDLAARIREEARALAALRHPNLVDVFDLGVLGDGRPYFAMEMLSGRDLRTELSRFGVIAVPAALDLIAQALSGLEASHRAGFVHRDVKLENLFLCDSGALKVVDFGIVKASRGGAALTGHGHVLGTVRCMAPEQHAGGAVDARTDVYAAGLSLYELVAGRGPFDELRGNDHATRFAHCERPPPRPSQLAPQAIPADVDEVILRALAKRPDDRFQSAGEMAVALRRLLVRRRREVASVAGRARGGFALAAAALRRKFPRVLFPFGV